MITLGHMLTLSSILFALSVAGIFINRKNVLLLLMCIELLLLAANFNFVAFSRYLGNIDGQVFVRRVIERAVARSVRDDRALPYWPDDIHVARAGLQNEAKFLGRIDGAESREETAHQRIVAVAAPGALVAAELQIECAPDGLTA